MAATDHNTLLDQLQSNVNLVLEQSGRVFASISEDSRKPPTAQVNKLKQIVPKAYGDFNDALDSLEEKLQFAQWVMRRDLALWRESAGLQDQSTNDQQPAQMPVTESPPASTSTQYMIALASATKHDELLNASCDDVAMEDAPPEHRPTTTEQPELDVDMAEDAVPTKTATPAAISEPNIEAQGQQESATKPPAQATSPAAKKPEPILQVDTATDVEETSHDAEDEKEPDTAKESINNDLDSLFDGGDTTNDANEFNFDENANGELDFGDFTNFSTDNGDNDNISSLLPGLEDYANTQTNNSNGVELDLNSFFNTDSNEQNNNSTQRDPNSNNNNHNNDNTTEQHDTTFDDLMNLNFDGPDMDNDAHNTTDLDFDSLFN